MEFEGTFNCSIVRIQIPDGFSKLFGMSEDRDLESFASDRVAKELQIGWYNTALLFIEAKKQSFKVGSRYLRKGEGA